MYKVLGIEGLIKLGTKEIDYDESNLLNKIPLPCNPHVNDDSEIAYFTPKTFLELLEIAKNNFDKINWDETVERVYKERAEKQYSEMKKFAKSKRLIVVCKT